MTPRGLRIVGAACVAAGVFDVAIVDAHLIDRFSSSAGGSAHLELAPPTTAAPPPLSAASPPQPMSPPPVAMKEPSPPIGDTHSNESSAVPAEVALKLPLESIHQFRVDAVTSSDARSIATLGAWLRETPSASVVLEGHTDQRGESLYNERLSLRRALWVETQLIRAGASAKQVKVVALGSTRPLATGNDEESFSQNRRVDVKLDVSNTKSSRPR